MLLMRVDAAVLAHLRRALAAHVSWCRRNAVTVPADVLALLAELDDDGGRSRPDGGEVVPLTVSYGEAATRLGVSRRTVGRMVATGRLARLGRRIVAASVEGAGGRPGRNGGARGG